LCAALHAAGGEDRRSLAAIRDIMEKRILGKTGEKLSVVGFGGIVVMDVEPKEATRLVAKAIHRGVNYFDVAPTYGNAQERLGPALEPFRSDVFLACKTVKRTRKEAAEKLRESLEMLRTDHFDLYQLHGVSSMEEVEEITARGGALEALVEAREKGLTRFLGFSAHDEAAALELMKRFQFDTILFPLNFVTWYQGKFGPRVFEEAKKRGMGILALKALALRPWRDDEEKKAWPKCWYKPVETAAEAALALRWTLSLPVTAVVSPGHAELLWWACDAADKFTAVTPRESDVLAKKAEKLGTIFAAT
jgi:predicted aldo/keto reductase-like oxidoreductase